MKILSCTHFPELDKGGTPNKQLVQEFSFKEEDGKELLIFQNICDNMFGCVDAISGTYFDCEVDLIRVPPVRVHDL